MGPAITGGDFRPRSGRSFHRRNSPHPVASSLASYHHPTGRAALYSTLYVHRRKPCSSPLVSPELARSLPPPLGARDASQAMQRVRYEQRRQ